MVVSAMRQDSDDEDEVLVLTEEDEKLLLANALRTAGCETVEELAAQARSGAFTSYAAQRAWRVVQFLVA